MTLTYGSLCSGVEGIGLGLHAAIGAVPVWQCEYDANPSAVLAARFPGVPNFGDLKALIDNPPSYVDIITAGYPCQPFSLAGLRKGTDDPRHLWPYIAEIVRRVGPRYVFLENVRGHLSMGFDTVLGSLADLGFDAEWEVFTASSVGAPHRRERLFVVAANADVRRREQRYEGVRRLPITDAIDGDVANADRNGPQGHDQAAIGRNNRHVDPTGSGALLESATRAWRREERLNDTRPRPDMGRYELAVQRWEHVHGPAPHPLAGKRLNPSFVEWMMGFPAGWVTDILPATAALKALGNAVVPHVAAHAWRSLHARSEAPLAA